MKNPETISSGCDDWNRVGLFGIQAEDLDGSIYVSQIDVFETTDNKMDQVIVFETTDNKMDQVIASL